MPRPVKVINEFKVRAGIADTFSTRSNELNVPPSAGVPFVSKDEGNAPAKFMRPTVCEAPSEQTMQSQS